MRMRNGFILEVATSSSYVYYSGQFNGKPTFDNNDMNAVFYERMDEAMEDSLMLEQDHYTVEISACGKLYAPIQETRR
jgi:hypothetical protein